MAKIKHIAIATQQPEETAKFYRETFDLRLVGKVDTDNLEGYYLTDGNVNLAIVRYKNDAMAGNEHGKEYTGIHHIGFQVEDMSVTDTRLRKANSEPRNDINGAKRSELGKAYNGRNVAFTYAGPNGVLLDVSHTGWVGTGQADAPAHAGTVHPTTPHPSTAHSPKTPHAAFRGAIHPGAAAARATR